MLSLSEQNVAASIKELDYISNNLDKSCYRGFVEFNEFDT